MVGFIALVLMGIGGYLLCTTPEKPAYSFYDDGYDLKRRFAIVLFVAGVVLGIGYLMYRPYADEQLAIDNAKNKISQVYTVPVSDIELDGMVCIVKPYRSDCETWEASFNVMNPEGMVSRKGTIKFSSTGDPVISNVEYGR